MGKAPLRLWYSAIAARRLREWEDLDSNQVLAPKPHLFVPLRTQHGISVASAGDQSGLCDHDLYPELAEEEGFLLPRTEAQRRPSSLFLQSWHPCPQLA